MKKQHAGMNTRAIKRKLGLDKKQAANMIHDIQHLLETEIFSTVKDDKGKVVFDKDKLMETLRHQVTVLQKECEEWMEEPLAVGGVNRPKEAKRTPVVRMRSAQEKTARH